MKRIIKMAGNLYGLDFDSVVNSYIDAGLHLGIDDLKIKKLILKHFRYKKIDFTDRGLYSIYN